MNGGYFCIAECVGCKKLITFNPHHVPSIRLTRTRTRRVPNPVGPGFATAVESYQGDREPVCQECWDKRQAYRKANGLPEEKIHPRAYEAEPEYDAGELE